VGIFDVSVGSSLRLENCTFTNITVPDNDYVTTTYDDWEGWSIGAIVIDSYPEDDADPSFDVQRRRANDSSPLEEGAPFLKMKKGSENVPGGMVIELFYQHFDINDKDRGVQGWTQRLKACR
jgi:hypothetical protein